MYGMDYDKTKGETTSFVGYITNHFKVNNYKVTYKPNILYDLIFLFDSAELGDKMVIDNFIEVEIGN